MRNLRNRFLLILMATSACLMNSGCNVTLGPQVRTEYTIMHPGRPMQVLENVKVKGRVLDGSGDAVEQDMGGWVAMPPSHFEAIKRSLEACPQK